MKVFVFIALALCAINVVRADDGSYRPDVYDRSRAYYQPLFNGRYNKYNNYNRNYGYQPLYQQLAPPYATYSERSVIPSTTARPVIITSTALPPKYVYAKTYGNEGYARIIEQDSDVNANSYQYKYKTENGISAGETGVVDASNSAGGTRVSGFYEYIGADGLTYRVDYTADENGFHPSGAHLP